MESNIENEYMNNLYFGQVTKPVEKLLTSSLLMTSALSSYEKFDNQNKEEYCTFCFIPFLRLIGNLQRFYFHKRELCIRYLDSMIFYHDKDFDEKIIEERIDELEHILFQMPLRESIYNEIQDILATLMQQTKSSRKSNVKSKSSEPNKTEHVWINPQTITKR